MSHTLAAPFRFVAADTPPVEVLPHGPRPEGEHRVGRAYELVLAAGLCGGLVLADRMRHTDTDEEFVALVALEGGGGWSALIGRAVMYAADGLLLPGSLEAYAAGCGYNTLPEAVTAANNLLADVPTSDARRDQFALGEAYAALGRARSYGWAPPARARTGRALSLRAALAGVPARVA